jgi:surface polysaccharide O-acyltransferase-like enzyme
MRAKIPKRKKLYNMETQRLVYLDILRIFAVFSMILLHVVGRYYGWYAPLPPDWQIFNVYDGVVRFCVPVFVMISGALFLNPAKEMSIKKLFSKNILRIVTAFVFWSACYAVYTSKIYMGITSNTATVFVKNFLLGHYHLWFLFMIVGLYLITPLLKKITADKKLVEYFLVLAFIFALVLPAVLMLPIPGKTIITGIVGKASVYFFLGYAVYYVAGHYFSTYQITKNQKILIYLLGIIGVLFTIFMTGHLTSVEGSVVASLYDNLLPNVGFVALGLFVFFKSLTEKLTFSKNLVQKIAHVSKWIFGAYLVHDFFNIIFETLGFSALTFNPIFSIPIVALAVFACSLLTSYLIHKIPFLNKHIV